MKLEYLSYIIAIHQFGSLSKAAEHLHTTPQNVSRVLQLLEAETQLSLFKRTSQGMLLTPAGEDALLFASNTLNEYHQLLTRNQQHRTFNKNIKGIVEISTFPTAGIPFLNDLILSFKRSYPNITIKCLEMDLKDSFEYFSQNNSTIAALPLENIPNISNQLHRFDLIPMLTSKLAVTVNKHHALAKKNALTLKQLTKEPLAIISKNTFQNSSTYILLSMNNLENQLKYSPFITSNIDQYYQAIIQNNYVSLNDELTFAKIKPLYQQQLVMIPLKESCTEIYYSIAMHKKAHLSEAATIFIDFCKTYKP